MFFFCNFSCKGTRKIIRKFVLGIIQRDKYSTFIGPQRVHVVIATEQSESWGDKNKDEKQGVKMALSISICLITFSSNSDHLTTFFCRQFCPLC